MSRETIEAFSTRRAEIEAAVAERGADGTAGNPRLAERAALMTRATKRDVDKAELRESWQRQAATLGFDAKALTADARSRESIDRSPGEPLKPEGSGANPSAKDPAVEAVAWAVDHLSEREAVFSRADLLTAALAWQPGEILIDAAERAVDALQGEGRLHMAPAFHTGEGMTTDRALADDGETIGLMRDGQDRARPVMRGWLVQAHIHRGPLTQGQKEAVKLILGARDRVVGVQGYAGTGKTAMLSRARALADVRGYRVIGLAPSASAAATLGREAGIRSETLQLFLARNAGIAEGRLSKKGEREMRAAFARTVLIVDEGSLASTVQARDLLRITNVLRIPRVVLVGDAKQLDAVDAGKPFAQLQAAGMKTAVMDEIMRQRDPELKAAVEASLSGEIARAFEKLGTNVAEVKADNIGGAVAARWLALSPEAREKTGVHGAEPRTPPHHQRTHPRASCPRGPHPWSGLGGERLVSKGYTNAEKALAANYSRAMSLPSTGPTRGSASRRVTSAAWSGSILGIRRYCSTTGERDRSLEAWRDRRAKGRQRGLQKRRD